MVAARDQNVLNTNVMINRTAVTYTFFEGVDDAILDLGESQRSRADLQELHFFPSDAEMETVLRPRFAAITRDVILRIFNVDAVKDSGAALATYPKAVEACPRRRVVILPGRTEDCNEATTSGMIDMLKLIAQYNSHGLTPERLHRRLVLVHGDHLTFERLRSARTQLGAAEFKTSDPVSKYYHGLDWVAPVPGLFHLQMKLVRVLLDIYWADADTFGSLCFCRSVLRRENVNVDGKDYHGARRFLLDVRDAYTTHLFGLELKNKPAGFNLSHDIIYRGNQLDKLVAQFVERLMFDRAVDIDDPHARSYLLVRDITLLEMLDRSIKYGDIGTVKVLLKAWTVLLQAAPGSKNYQACMMELLACLNADWSAAFAQHAWVSLLVNESGRTDGFIPRDLLQEHMIRSEKDLAPTGLGSKGDFAVKGISQTKDIFGKLAASMRSGLGIHPRGSSHTTAAALLDVKLLVNKFRSASSPAAFWSVRSSVGVGSAQDDLLGGIQTQDTMMQASQDATAAAEDAADLGVRPPKRAAARKQGGLLPAAEADLWVSGCEAFVRERLQSIRESGASTQIIYDSDEDPIDVAEHSSEGLL